MENVLTHPDAVHAVFNLCDAPVVLVQHGVETSAWSGDSYVLSPCAGGAVRFAAFCAARFADLHAPPSEVASVAVDLGTGIPEGSLLALWQGGNPFVHKSRTTEEMRAILERIESCPYHGSLRSLYLEGKILELLALRLAQVLPPTPATPRPALSRRQVQRLHEARALVAQRMGSPPTLRELARQVAMSTTVLKQGFRVLFGETVFEYLRGLRLESARRMLVDQGASVKEAGYAVGYSSLSHFARAFREHFGYTPRAWARLAGVARQRRQEPERPLT